MAALPTRSPAWLRKAHTAVRRTRKARMAALPTRSPVWLRRVRLAVRLAAHPKAVLPARQRLTAGRMAVRLAAQRRRVPMVVLPAHPARVLPADLVARLAAPVAVPWVAPVRRKGLN